MRAAFLLVAIALGGCIGGGESPARPGGGEAQQEREGQQGSGVRRTERRGSTAAGPPS